MQLRQTVSRAEYLADLARLRSAVAVCQRDRAACALASGSNIDPKLKTLLATQLTVADPGRPGFRVRFDWLASALTAAGQPEDHKDGLKPEERADLLRRADDRLAQDAAALDHAATSPDVSAARQGAQAVLRGREFHSVEQESYLAAKLAFLGLILDRIFSGVANLMPNSPWVGLLMEWSVFGLAAAAVLIWVWRLNQQQRIQIASDQTGARTAWERHAEDWARRAEAEAAREDWREAVHCLYWSAIVMLEGRKLWRENGARTPREYLALLEAGSARHGALARLTGVFERIWYGLRSAARTDYEGARAMLEELRSL